MSFEGGGVSLASSRSPFALSRLKIEMKKMIFFPWILLVSKLSDLVAESLDPEMALVLTNAIYFKDSWTAPFEDLEDPEDLVWISNILVLNVLT